MIYIKLALYRWYYHDYLSVQPKNFLGTLLKHFASKRYTVSKLARVQVGPRKITTSSCGIQPPLVRNANRVSLRVSRVVAWRNERRLYSRATLRLTLIVKWKWIWESESFIKTWKPPCRVVVCLSDFALNLKLESDLTFFLHHGIISTALPLVVVTRISYFQGFVAYLGFMHVLVAHRHPVMLVFCELLSTRQGDPKSGQSIELSKYTYTLFECPN